jgi:putative ABC transport system ATP-binding protein
LNKKFIYQLKNIKFSYPLKNGSWEALHDLTLDLPEAKCIALIGPSGSGKSTLLHLLGLLENVQQGELAFQNECVKSLSEKEKNQLRRSKIGFIFQEFHLMPVLTVEENVSYFLKTANLSKDVITERTEKALKAVGLWEHKNKKPGQLSGGQKQRVAIARAIVKNPSVILADEPTANLDQNTGREIMELFKTLIHKHNVTVIVSTHDPMVLEFADEKYSLKDGKIEQRSVNA